MMNNWIMGDLDDMIFGDCQQQISEVFELMNGSVRTCHIKAALEMRGFRKSYTRAPQQRRTTPEELAKFRPGLQEIFRAEGYFG